jgi:GH15 family glucan-1,4-alpha-glucosidase
MTQPGATSPASNAGAWPPWDPTARRRTTPGARGNTRFPRLCCPWHLRQWRPGRLGPLQPPDPSFREQVTSHKIEDYALLGDTRTAALVSKDGSVDWLCAPRFDSPACFAALLGSAKHGRWLLTPTALPHGIQRRYRDDTLVLETDYETDGGSVRVIDTMAPVPAGQTVTLVRIVEGRSGHVSMRMDLSIRFGYGLLAPRLERVGDDLLAVSGPDALRLSTPIDVADHGGRAGAEFVVSEGQRIPFVLTWFPSHEPEPVHLDPEYIVTDSERWWGAWAERCTYDGEWREAVIRSLLTLKSLTYAPTGGIVAAPTTSLPEELGGTRNWDYRFCWLRDATFTLAALHGAGFSEEALAWRDWLLRAVAGDPAKMQIVYGPGGERHLPEWEADWLPGFADSAPVRIGNAATSQFQLDVYGEVAHSQYQLVGESGFRPGQQKIVGQVLEFLESAWSKPDQGIWEVRSQPRHFTYSKVMAWVAFDRAVKVAEQAGLEGPVERWREVRDLIHAEVCAKGFDAKRNTFVQSYGRQELDASLLRIPLVGFLPPTDPRVTGTVDAIRDELTIGNGLLLRYSPGASGEVDGVAGAEGAFLACSFWLVDALTLIGRGGDARALFEHLLTLRNDVGLLAEEYDTNLERLVGNFPQALSHLGLVNSALLLSKGEQRITPS